ncbi:methyltransferase type 11 [Streptomyces sp. CB02923]|uniref:class I SAM-dependent methyltransferase n=1 Tax=Streptomyces sp. CB02923 TaxID=1718985 RepID=UPI0009393005|nr:class I SAM-dependent methyltransferase [Streptomyces sp. CB02923]OKH99218.1 methyltransferase type 11 [Streptomyces sp. CB02923]
MPDPTDFDEAERRAWTGRAQAYERSFASLCAHPVPALLDAAGIHAGSRVLDVGTGSRVLDVGTGTAARAAGERGASVTAVDADPGMTARAAAASPGVYVCVAGLPRLPFAADRFGAVIGNFVLNHVGRPGAALAELRRVARSGARIALTIWAAPPASGQALFGCAIRAAGVTRPAHLPTLAPEDDFPRTEEGFARLLRDAGLTDVRCSTLAWEHRASPEEWWSGPAAGVATAGQVITSRPPAVVAEIRRHYDAMCADFTGPDGMLVLPHAALLGSGRV